LFIDIDYSKRLKTAKIQLAKPNKQIISSLSEKFRDDLSLKWGSINELNFSIPHSIIDEDTNKPIFNPNVDLIKEKMLIKITLDGYREWYVIDSIEEDGSDIDVLNVKCFSLGQELSGKRISGLVEESINATNLLTELLESTVWSIGEVDDLFDQMFRSFESGDDSNVLDCLINAGETYGALIKWDTENRKISFKDISKDGSFKGMTVNYGKFLNSIKRMRTTDEMVTRLFVEGSDGLEIHSANPTGMPYIEDFSFFMYPFERDESRKVIKSSDFMSDALCHAILDHIDLVIQNSPEIKLLTENLFAKQAELVIEQSTLDDLKLELANILDLLDTAKSAEDDSGIAQRQTEYDAKEVEVTAQEAVVSSVSDEIDNINSQIDSLQSDIATQANFTDELLNELNLYIIEKKWKDDRYIDVEELYSDAVKKFEEMRQPKIVIEASIENLLNIIEEQYYWDKIVLGDLIKVKYPQMKIEYMAKIIEINYDLENGEVNLTIANTKDLLNETDKLVQLLYQNSSASTLLQNNKFKWDKIEVITNQVSNLLNSEWDANKNKIIAGVKNSIEIGNRGIIIKNPDFPNEVVIIQSGIIALSKDGGDTWKTAIKPDGIVAERLIGKVIAGENLLITNNSGSFVMDNNGVRINASAFVVESSDRNLVDDWNNSTKFTDEIQNDSMITPFEKDIVKSEWDRIEMNFDSYMIELDGYYEDGGDSLQFVKDYKDRYTDLFNYLFVDLHGGSKPILIESNMDYTTLVDKPEYDLVFRNLNLAETILRRELSLRASFLADEAKDIAEKAQTNIDEVENDIVYKTELHSSNGTQFNNGVINTTLSAVVYKGKDNITNTLPVSAFVWEKSDRNGVLDTAWANAHINIGSVIEITKNDVDKKATFWCDINIV
jgi:hypothetical protein